MLPYICMYNLPANIGLEKNPLQSYVFKTRTFQYINRDKVWHLLRGASVFVPTSVCYIHCHVKTKCLANTSKDSRNHFDNKAWKRSEGIIFVSPNQLTVHNKQTIRETRT
jgi:hypothetical protein